MRKATAGTGCHARATATSKGPREMRPVKHAQVIVPQFWPDRANRLDGLVLVAGKGHEDYQEVAGVRHPFADARVAAAALAAWGEA